MLRRHLFAIVNTAWRGRLQRKKIKRKNTSFSTHGDKEAPPTELHGQLGHSDIRTTLDICTQIANPEIARMVNQVTNGILAWM
jgi:hypothetical protein